MWVVARGCGRWGHAREVACALDLDVLVRRDGRIDALAGADSTLFSSCCCQTYLIKKTIYFEYLYPYMDPYGFLPFT